MRLADDILFGSPFGIDLSVESCLSDLALLYISLADSLRLFQRAKERKVNETQETNDVKKAEEKVAYSTSKQGQRYFNLLYNSFLLRLVVRGKHTIHSARQHSAGSA